MNIYNGKWKNQKEAFVDVIVKSYLTLLISDI